MDLEIHFDLDPNHNAWIDWTPFHQGRAKSVERELALSLETALELRALPIESHQLLIGHDNKVRC